jgi:gamma-glutamyl phosphate reductase
MNDVTFVEASRGIAQRIMHDSKTPEQRVSHAFRLVLAREPKADELRLLLANWQDQLARFRSDPAAAKAFISAGESPRDEKLPAAEHAAYAALCALIMNLDEAITRP